MPRSSQRAASLRKALPLLVALVALAAPGPASAHIRTGSVAVDYRARVFPTRLPLTAQSEEILGVTVRKVTIPVAAGRNLAVLVEAAVRNEILKLRGIDSTAEFLARQRQQMAKDE